ncbi:hypothetical protein [Caulobacter segnis]|uniref:TnsA endonuclease N-terminal domain-containing protein n=1 Tax=Caulobacter segnis TaxID=88688 RepID=A0A2W5UYN4_9CAUL|nr:hypothetical protein [Caulobacter segnis]PZR32919.1 MAG: hypothetical protein DI526_14980 [Caulobacter segnis]
MPKQIPGEAIARPKRQSVPEAEMTVRALLQAGLTRAKDSADWASISAATRIVLPSTDGPMREVITGRNIRPTGSYGSRKAGRPLAFESMNERAVFVHSEVDIRVANYLSQPCRFEFVLDGVRRSYVPDCARILADGTLEILEVKGDRRDLTDVDYRRKLDHVAQVCRVVGWSFRIVFAAPLRARTVRNATIQLIEHHRLAQYGAKDVFVVHERLAAASTPLPLGELAQAFGDEVVGRAKICAMMVGRCVAIDLNAPLTRSSPVNLPPTAHIGALDAEGAL